MPLYKKFEINGATIGIWHITENVGYFEHLFTSFPYIQNDGKRLQWFATRHLANELTGNRTEIVKLETGKPVLLDGTHQISISHSVNFAAVIVHPNKPVGIDIEPVNPKVERIAHKFLQNHELISLPQEHRTDKLILYWSAKETMYKLQGLQGIEFSTQLLIQPFTLAQYGTLDTTIKHADSSIQLKVYYEFFENHVFTYAINT
jgi:phosphopantetheinyl transferase